MYKEKYDALPTKYWILNEGDVDILPLDTAQELTEDKKFGATQISSMSSRTEMDNDTITNKNDLFTDKFRVRDNVSENNGETKEKLQLLLELPNYLNLVICFKHREDANEYYEKLSNAIKFQVQGEHYN
jgi:hypothetical protein